MKTFYCVLTFISIAIFTNSCKATKIIKGNGNIIQKELNIKDYQKLSFGGKAEIVYEQRKDTSAFLRIEIDENLVEFLDIDSKQRKLKIKSKKKTKISPTKFTIYTNSPSLERIELAGSVSCQLNGNIAGASLTLKTAGSTNITGDSLSFDKIKIASAGTAKLELTGKVSNLEYNSAGNSNAYLYNLKADNVSINVAGSSTLIVYANKVLNVNGAGSCSIKYGGSPEIKQSISGSGSVKKID